MPLDTWCDRVLPDAARDGLVIGINWSGSRLVGWSFMPKEVLNRLAAANYPTASPTTARSRRQQVSAHPRVRKASWMSSRISQRIRSRRNQYR